MRMTNIDVSIIIVNYDITSLVVNAIDSLFHKIKDLTIEIIRYYIAYCDFLHS